MKGGQGSSKICQSVMETSKGLQWAGGQWVRATPAYRSAVLREHRLATGAGEAPACRSPTCSAPHLGAEGLGCGQWGRRAGGSRTHSKLTSPGP